MALFCRAVANHQKKMKLENLKKVVDEGKKKTMTLKWKGRSLTEHGVNIKSYMLVVFTANLHFDI